MEEFDISSEEYREVVFMLNGSTYRIDNPITLFRRKGGTTHRVLDAQGMFHCYPAPEACCLTAIRWKNRDPEKYEKEPAN